MVTMLWVASAIAVVTAAIRSRRHASAVRMGRLGVGFLFIVAGAAMNGWFLMRGDDYGEFASGSYIPFVRDTWQSVVVPNHELWIGMLIVFELRHRRAQPGRSEAHPTRVRLGDRVPRLPAELRLGLLPVVHPHGGGAHHAARVERRTGPTRRAVTGPEPTARALINVLPKT